MHEIGEPIVIVHSLPGTPEEDEQNKEDLKVAVERICSRFNCFETRVNIHFDDHNK